MSSPKPFAVIIPSREQRSTYLDALAFLLKKDLVVQLHAYILVMAPQYVKLGYSLEEHRRMRGAVNGAEDTSRENSRLSRWTDTSSVIATPGQASDAEREWLNRIVANQPREIQALFEK